MDNSSPSPNPRTSPPIPLRQSTKKPIPLPRFKKRRESLEKSNSQTRNQYSNTDSLDGSPKQSVTQMLKDEFKSASDNVQERGKHVMESTRRLARNIIPKRFTAQQEYSGRDNPLMSGSLTDRCQSLPSDDIFQSISFDSPLTPSSEMQLSFDDNEVSSGISESADNHVEYYPPPLYPPPPPPDEALYDEVSSMKSSHSGSHRDPYCTSDVDSYQDIDGIYEELSNTRSQDVRLSEDQDPQCSGFNTFQFSDSEAASLPLPNKKGKKFLRSDSWTFYDTVSCSQGESSLGDSVSNIYNEDPVVVASASRKAACSSSPSLCSELEALTIATDESASNGSCNQSSPGGSAGTSVSSESYHSANLSSAADGASKDFRVELRKKNYLSRQKLPSKSVIFEFDPLYENVPTAECLANSNLTENDLMILAGFAPAKESKTSNYGKIKIKEGGSVVTVEEEEEGAAVRPPTPPARFDSMSIASTEISDCKNEERSVDVPDDAVSPSSSIKSSTIQTDVELNTSRFSLLRQHWPSMKRVIKSAYHRDSKVLPSEVPILSMLGEFEVLFNHLKCLYE